MDTNLLLVYLAGRYRPGFIQEWKRTRAFGIGVFRQLEAILSQSSALICTSSVLTECSNFVFQLSGPHFEAMREQLIRYVHQITEIHTAAAETVRQPPFAWLGLTDCALTRLPPSILVITDDARLKATLESLHRPAITLN